MEYFVVLQEYRDTGIEGVAHPELTRAQIVNCIKSREFDNIVQIDHVHGAGHQRIVTDVTQELIDQAEAELAEPFGGADEYALPHSVLPPVR